MICTLFKFIHEDKMDKSDVLQVAHITYDKLEINKSSIILYCDGVCICTLYEFWDYDNSYDDRIYIYI